MYGSSVMGQVSNLVYIPQLHTYTSDGDVGAPALRDGDLVGGAGRAHVRPARPGRRQPEGEGGRR